MPKKIVFQPSAIVQCSTCKDLFVLDWDYQIRDWEMFPSTVVRLPGKGLYHNKEQCSGKLNVWVMSG